MATDAAYEPFEYTNRSGVIKWFDIDVVKAIAAKSGLRVKFIKTQRDNIFKTLDTGGSDVVVSSATITDERKKRWIFQKIIFMLIN